MALRKPALRRNADGEPVLIRENVSADEYFAMPETVQRQDLIDGELIVAPAPIRNHQYIVIRIIGAIQRYCDQHGGHAILSPTDVELDTDLVLQPDAGYIAPGSATTFVDHVVGPPDLVVEVLSPGTRHAVHERKMVKYARYGVREAWVVDPAAGVTTVYFNDAGAWKLAGTAPFGLPIPSSVVEAGDAGLRA